MGESLAAFDGAANLLVSMVDQIPDSAWEEPGLGSWTVRELVAHAHRGLTTVEDYLLHPVEPVKDPKMYASPDAVAARAREAVSALGEHPARTVRETRDRVLVLVAAAPLDTPVGAWFGEVSLGEYLPSRTAELTVHSVDLADALGVTADVPDLAMSDTFQFLATRASRRGQGVEVLRALSGRAPLPAGFSVF